MRVYMNKNETRANFGSYGCIALVRLDKLEQLSLVLQMLQSRAFHLTARGAITAAVCVLRDWHE